MANKITNIKERILYLSDYQGEKKEKFFENLGLQYGNFKGKAKNTPLNSDSLAIIIAKYPNVNPHWLLTGDGEMLKQSVREEFSDAENAFIDKLFKQIDHLQEISKKNGIDINNSNSKYTSNYTEKDYIIETQRKYIDMLEQQLRLLQDVKPQTVTTTDVRNAG